jgi:dTDP-4-amino-4,6-dideoxygalactose transaminase
LGCYGDGGAIFTNDDELAEKISSIVNHGMKIRYYHDRIGVNSRLDTIQAAVLRVKLPHLDEYNSARRKAADYYDKAFKNCSKIKTPTRSKFSTHTFHQYTLVLNNVDRKALMEHLSSKGIASAVYYPVALHNQKAFQDFKYNSKDFPVTDKLCESVISLPMNTELDDKTLKYICDSVLEFVEKNHS